MGNKIENLISEHFGVRVLGAAVLGLLPIVLDYTLPQMLMDMPSAHLISFIYGIPAAGVGAYLAASVLTWKL